MMYDQLFREHAALDKSQTLNWSTLEPGLHQATFQNVPLHPLETSGNARHHLLKEIDTGHQKLLTSGRGRRHQTTCASPGTGAGACSPLTTG